MAAVILFHADVSGFSGGFVGVDVFLVISGYLITSLILSEKQSGTFSLAAFYERRVRRILPALFLVVFATIPLAWISLLPIARKQFSESVGAVALFCSNVLFWQQSDYFGTAADLKPLLHTWSLSLEEQYYVLFPLTLLALWRFGQRWIFGALAVLAVASYLAAIWATRAYPAFSFYLLPTRAWEILAGALVALLLSTSTGLVRRGRLAEVISFAGLIAIVASVFFFDRYVAYPSSLTLVPVLGSVMIIMFATPETTVGRWLSTPPMVHLGLISYSAYMWHQPLLAFVRNVSVDKPGAGVVTGIVMLTLVLAFLSWKYVETPFRRRDRRHFGRAQVFVFGLTGTVICVAVAAAGHFTNGLETGTEKELASYEKYPHQLYDGDGTCLLRTEQSPANYGAQCRPANAEGGKLIWGDSHAGALSFGLRRHYSNLIQLTAHGCPPLVDIEISSRPGCRDVNDFVVKQISKIKPGVAYLDANWMLYTNIDLSKFLGRTIEVIRSVSPSTDIIIIGPVPLWRPSLPAAMTRQKQVITEYLYLRNSDFQRISAIDTELEKEAGIEGVWYFSALKAMCKREECLATTELDGKATLTTWDAGHLTAGGAEFLAKKILNQ